MWDLAAARPVLVLVLRGHAGQVFDVVFSPDGQRPVISRDGQQAGIAAPETK